MRSRLESAGAKACVSCSAAVLLLTFANGCLPAGHARAQRKDGAEMNLISSAFANMGEIPRKHTCEGGDVAPPFAWKNVPHEAKSLALIVDDPDAPDPKAPKMTWVHWVVFDMPTVAVGLPEGGKLPAGARVGLNDWKRASYGGPCPPIGRHRYFHKLYALDVTLGLSQPTKAELEAAMAGHILAQAELVGTYQKSK